VVASRVRTQRRGSKYEWVGRANEEEEEEEEEEDVVVVEEEFNKAMVFSGKKAAVFSGEADGATVVYAF
jgi:broad specificity polyphosphatase/5'/3'-nucleotidase SurE